jgi:hypothetical protein
MVELVAWAVIGSRVSADTPTADWAGAGRVAGVVRITAEIASAAASARLTSATARQTLRVAGRVQGRPDTTCTIPLMAIPRKQV